MLKNLIWRTTARDIKKSPGRFFAIFAIIALGVGFFSGVRITTPVMVNTINDFYENKQFFDYRLVSTCGFDKESVEEFANYNDVRFAEGSYSFDILCQMSDNTEIVLKAHSLPEKINKVKLVDGRMPENDNECIIDSRLLRDDIEIGSMIDLSENNEKSTLSNLKSKSYKIVGSVDSSYYINFERGTSSIGSGSISGFVYMLPETFSMDLFSEVFIKFDTDEKIYSDKYNDYMSDKKVEWENLADEIANKSYERMIVRMSALSSEESAGQTNPTDNSILDSVKPETYVLGRGTNIGYTCFESDSEIVEQVARVFPVFFILVAALVCMTTMSRMVEEQRSQIGIFKALGYSQTKIIGKFLSYAAGASLLGCVTGYAIGVIVFPKIIWESYELMYISLPIKYIIDWKLAIISLLVSAACSIGITFAVCLVELLVAPAALMRPKAPKPGKRVLIENITFIWKKLSFLHKVSIRNVFRYKGRFLMMIVGISGCMALLLTGFGIKDSIAGFAQLQYEQIQVADGSVSFKEDILDSKDVPKTLIDETSDYVLTYHKTWNIVVKDKTKAIEVIAAKDSNNLDDYMKFIPMSDGKIEYPDEGEAIIGNSISDRYGVKKGDYIVIRNDDLKEMRLLVTGVFENHVYNNIFINHKSIEKLYGESVGYNSAYINFKEDGNHSEAAASISMDKMIASVTAFDTLKERLSEMMKSLNYIVLVIIVCAAGLAFIVIYNLTNINITERITEIATIKVLGFFKNETSAYVFRENIFMTVFGMIFGIGLGVALHRFVMKQIVVDMVSFKTAIFPQSFVYSIVLTLVFNVGVNLVMGRKLEKIDMAQALKSVE